MLGRACPPGGLPSPPPAPSPPSTSPPPASSPDSSLLVLDFLRTFCCRTRGTCACGRGRRAGAWARARGRGSEGQAGARAGASERGGEGGGEGGGGGGRERGRDAPPSQRQQPGRLRSPAAGRPTRRRGARAASGWLSARLSARASSSPCGCSPPRLRRRRRGPRRWRLARGTQRPRLWRGRPPRLRRTDPGAAAQSVRRPRGRAAGRASIREATR